MFLNLADENSIFQKNQQNKNYDHRLVPSLPITLKLIERPLCIKKVLTKFFWFVDVAFENILAIVITNNEKLAQKYADR